MHVDKKGGRKQHSFIKPHGRLYDQFTTRV